ncbi:MAG: hypothetical protein AB1714_31990 [Acidobacteriota bacterium]
MSRNSPPLSSGVANSATPKSVPSVFPPRRDFASLSMRDLLDAREAYHVHLSAISNILATAAGRYWIHKDDWYAKNPPDVERPKDFPRVDQPRTLLNSLVRPWSWPAVLVFVREWKPRRTLDEDSIPRRLCLPDGRIVPTCVILASPDESLPPPANLRGNASSMIGGGYQCIRRGQGTDYAGTFACLVQREGVFYALTNKHVAGSANDKVEAIVRGQRRPVGTAESTVIAKRTLSGLFPAWPGERSIVNVDAGLVRIDDMSSWASQVFGIGEVGEIFDATSETVTLDLIGCPVRAFGGASGAIEGEIKALFFRYRSMGDFDYLSDLLVGPRPASVGEEGDGRRSAAPNPQTLPGDSGTIWFYDPPNRGLVRGDSASEPVERGIRARRLRPIAMQWGGARFALPDGTKSAYALATFLSTVCHLLDADVVRDWSIGFSEYWGKLAHFAIGWKACDMVTGDLRTLMQANQKDIGFDDQTLGQGSAFRRGRNDFVPLADVPDYVWLSPRAHEGQQHFADIDIAAPGGTETMLDACVRDPGNLSATVWRDFFKSFKELGCGPGEGSLPFRVWQIWDAMVGFLRGGDKPDLAQFVCAAGVLAHYVGDASMPLHCSYLHHGRPPMKQTPQGEFPVAPGSDEYKAYKKTAPAKIHSIYDEGIFEIDTSNALAAVSDLLVIPPEDDANVSSGHEAAVEVILLMDRSAKRLSPEEIIEMDDPELKPKARARSLWSNPKLQKAATAAVADSTKLLARLWASAWRVGDGDRSAAGMLTPLTERQVEEISHDPNFLPSMTLDQMTANGKFEAPASSASNRNTRSRARLSRRPTRRANKRK